MLFDAPGQVNARRRHSPPPVQQKSPHSLRLSGGPRVARAGARDSYFVTVTFTIDVVQQQTSPPPPKPEDDPGATEEELMADESEEPSPEAKEAGLE